jgi:flavin-binding protein dodecin
MIVSSVPRFNEGSRFASRRLSPNSQAMSDHIYKKLELVGSSPDGFEAAVKNALGRASKTIRNMRWFEVIETRGHIEEGGTIDHWQVTLKVGFTLDS